MMWITNSIHREMVNREAEGPQGPNPHAVPTASSRCENCTKTCKFCESRQCSLEAGHERVGLKSHVGAEDSCSRACTSDDEVNE